MSNDIHALSGAYAVDALDDAERAEFERHLAVCESCRHEVDDLRLAAAEIAATTDTEPPASLRDSVLAGIRDVRPLPPEGPESAVAATGSATGDAVVEPSVDDYAESPGAVPASRPGEGSGEGSGETLAGVHHLPRRRIWARVGLAAAAAAIVAGGTTVAIHPWTDDAPSGPVANPAAQVIHASDVQHYSGEAGNGAKVTVYRSVALDQAVVVTKGLKPAPAGKVYELWLQTPAGAMKPAGLFTDGSDLTQLVRGRAGRARGLGITLEPSGGSPVPTTTPLALVSLT